MSYRAWVLSFLFLLFACFLWGDDVLVVSGHPDYPPVSMDDDGILSGASIELARTIFTELEIPFEINATGPWARVQMNSKNGVIDVIAFAYKNSVRDEYMEFSIPYMVDPVSIFIAIDNLKTFPSLRKLITKDHRNITTHFQNHFNQLLVMLGT